MIYSFLLIGQSNMAGRGRLGEVEPITNENVLMFRENEWIVAEEPIHTDKSSIAGIGLGMSFANEIQIKYKKTIGLIPCAMGGTSLNEWRKDGELYLNAMNTARKVMKDSKLIGILWHQGEADSGNIELAHTYKERFLNMINSLMSDLNVQNLPIIIGELGDFLPLCNYNCEHYSIINKSLNQLCRENDNFTIVSANGLTDNGDKLHFDSKSQREFGLRYARAWEDGSSKKQISFE